MRYSAEHKQQTRARILAAAGQLFRREGFGGSGIDGLTKAAGVTNGAFYGHFKTKREAFQYAMLDGLEQLRLGIAELKAGRGRRWLKTFVDIYLGTKRTCELGEACALASLSTEVMRADRELRRLIEEVATGLSDRATAKRDDAAIGLLALLAGGVTLARAVADPALSERIALAVGRHALTISAPER
jgi:TetR/AcrR family transcriptional repressor of nem operon